MPHFDSITFLWPSVLIGFLLLPLLLLAYLKQERSYWKRAFRFSYYSALEHLSTESSLLRRSLAPLIVGTLTSLLLLAVSQPQLLVKVPRKVARMMLLIDVSYSMEADDLLPSRIDAARDAAISFVENLPKNVQLGLVFFAREAQLMSKPTENKEQVLSALRNLNRKSLQSHTAVGSAIKEAMRHLDQTLTKTKKSETSGSELLKEPPQRMIVLLGDGDSTSGYDASKAAKEAHAENIVIHTIGVGTKNSVTLKSGWLSKTGVFFNEETLKSVARESGGKYFHAINKEAFSEIYTDIQGYLTQYSLKAYNIGPYLTLAAILFLFLIICFLLTQDAFKQGYKSWQTSGL